jgi:hypothetical protein
MRINLGLHDLAGTGKKQQQHQQSDTWNSHNSSCFEIIGGGRWIFT